MPRPSRPPLRTRLSRILFSALKLVRLTLLHGRPHWNSSKRPLLLPLRLLLPFLLTVFFGLTIFLLTASSPSSPRLARLSYLPRLLPSQFALPAVRPTLQHPLGAVPIVPIAPQVRLLLLCPDHTPCCHAALTLALQAALHQTLLPTSLSIFHSCRPSKTSSFETSATAFVRSSLNSSASEIPSSYLSFVHCPSVSPTRTPMSDCLLTHLSSPILHNDSVRPDLLLSTSDIILEPSAIESLHLYLALRPSLSGVRPLPYNLSTLSRALRLSDPLSANASLPSTSPRPHTPVHPLPLLLSHLSVRSHFSSSISSPHWHAFARLLSNVRLLSLPLFVPNSNPNNPRVWPPTLALTSKHFREHQLPPHLWSDHAFYKSSLRADLREKYRMRLNTPQTKRAVDLSPLPFRPVRPALHAEHAPRVMFIMPWLQMGGSEKSVLDVALNMAHLNWSVSFLLSMPFWTEDPLGEVATKHEWIGNALSITPDVLDIVKLAPNHMFSRLLRYFLESRNPHYILTANSRMIYEHLPFIKTVLPMTVVADYNHMVHATWKVVPGKGGGMPRFGTTYTNHIDLHLTASENVTASMKSWIEPDVLERNPNKVRTCHIGADPASVLSGDHRLKARARMRAVLGINSKSIVVLFAGRYVADKRIEVMGQVVRDIAKDPKMAQKFSFVFVGSGDQKPMLEETQRKLKGKHPVMILRPPAVGIAELRQYYAMADVLLLPSNNEGIALVLYEAMAAGLLVMATNVGGQKELVNESTGILLPLMPKVGAVSFYIVRQLFSISRFSERFNIVRESGTQVARTRFTTDKFCECVINNLMEARETMAHGKQLGEAREKALDAMRETMGGIMKGERVHALWNMRRVERSIEGVVTIGVKTYACDMKTIRQVVDMVLSIRYKYPKVRVLIANDGPKRVRWAKEIKGDPYTEEVVLDHESGDSVGRNVLVNMTTTEFLFLLNDDHIFDNATDVALAVKGIHHFDFDIVGVRVREQGETEWSGSMDKGVARVTRFENGELTLCGWDEQEPIANEMRVPLKVDTVHSAMLVRIDVLRAYPWKNELKLNAHMTLFLEMRDAGLRVGYLPSVSVVQKERVDSWCDNRMREDLEKKRNVLDDRDRYLWDGGCGSEFSKVVAKHLKMTKRPDWIFD